MKVIVIGGGEVGVELTKRLVNENQDVTLIEQNERIIDKIRNKLDVLIVKGNGASIDVLKEADIKGTDLLIAVTQIDEINIISCMIAKKFGVKKTVARIRNEEYEDGSQVLTNEQLGIDIIINPERVAAQEIAKIIRTPNVNEIEYFADGKALMIGFCAHPESMIVNKKLKDLPLPEGCFVVAIVRKNEEVVIPRGDDLILPKDRFYIMGKRGILSEIGWLTRHRVKKSQKVIIFGGGMIGFKLANLLEKNKKNGFEIKIIDKDYDRCKLISECLKKSLVIQGDVTDMEFLKEEEIDKGDVVVALTGDDEVNLLTTLLANKLGAKKTISEVIKPDYNIVLDSIGIDTIVSPRLLTVGKIMKLIKKGDFLSLTILKDEQAQVVELIVSKGSIAVGKSVLELELKKGINIGVVVRENEVIIPRGNTILNPYDRLVIFAKKDMDKYLAELFSEDKLNINPKMTEALYDA